MSESADRSGSCFGLTKCSVILYEPINSENSMRLDRIRILDRCDTFLIKGHMSPAQWLQQTG